MTESPLFVPKEWDDLDSKRCAEYAKSLGLRLDPLHEPGPGMMPRTVGSTIGVQDVYRVYDRGEMQEVLFLSRDEQPWTAWMRGRAELVSLAEGW